MTFAGQTPPNPDQELLRGFLSGDRGAHRIVEGWARMIVRFRPYGIPQSEQDDIVQLSMGMLWTACSRGDFTLRTVLHAMVRKIVLARCVDRVRRQRPTTELDESFIDPSPGTEESFLEEERFSRVHRAIQRLGERCREIIRLHFLDELPYAELAMRMGLAQSTLRVRMFHCIREVRQLLDAEERESGNALG